MKVSDEGIAFLKRLEGFDKKCDLGGAWKAHYDTIAGIYDMPYGITRDLEGNKIGKDDIWSDEYVNEVFAGLVKRFENKVNKYLEGCELSQNQYDAVFSLVWNIGEGNFSTSSVLKRIKAKDYENVPSAFMMWNGVVSRIRQPDGTLKKIKIPITGLINRRKAEIKVWRFSDYGN